MHMCSADDFYHFPFNATRSTVSGIAAYRSALTLDWLAGEDSRQRELANSFEIVATIKPRPRSSECIAFTRPAAGKVARLMLELVKNLEGDEGTIIPELIQGLMNARLLMETSMLESEPDLNSLVHTPGAMMGEPHTTFPRILAMVWLIGSDPITTKKSGWCSVKKFNKYLMIARPTEIATHMRALDPIIARARFIIESFIQNVTPLNMQPETTTQETRPPPTTTTFENDLGAVLVEASAPPLPPPPPAEFFVDPLQTLQDVPEQEKDRISLSSAKGLQQSMLAVALNIKDFSAVIESGPLRFIKRVLICSNEEASEQIMEHRLDIFTLFPNMTIEFLDVRQCPHEIRSDRHGDKSILAVIAPEPFDDIPDSEVPIYFYEAPYFLENLDAYSNNIPALIDWRPLKHAFTHFFEQQGWIRIAIVSDNSPYSAAFEEELVGHFNEKQLVYNVQRCVETLHHDCDFKEALQFIIDNNALIVVANVDARNAWVLLKQAREHGVTRKNEFIWLARDWPFVNVSKKELFDISPIISLTLAPLMKETANPELHSKATRGPHLARILQGLTLVEDAVRHTKRYRIDHFYRDIAKHMNSAIIKDTYDARAFIRKIDVNDKSEVLTIVVANSQLVTSVTTVNNSTPKILVLLLTVLVTG
ncbi:hypothetical protein MSG28_009343 [Choristoneura fumiferana]|uniref:Uncharacterized protein n=1 Tax=Choristoneura fumiferana TaxID=7141 RepID=A0ACC0KX11_CHOFU|nr:hypothetical protein MSG28_009343 [Choristoneura fumiferana]